MNAIILAAGMGTRLLPFTGSTPKPLLEINNIPVIEQQIRFLHEIGITDITIVTGYQAFRFHYLADRYHARLIFNPRYSDYNNLYSLYLCRHFLEDTYIMEGDTFLHSNFLLPWLTSSTYFIGLKNSLKGEWVVLFKEEKLLDIIIDEQHPAKSAESGYVLSGVSFWKKQDAAHIRSIMEKLINADGKFADPAYISRYWDHVVYENLSAFSIQAKLISPTDWNEIDTPADLQQTRTRFISLL